MFGAHVMSKKVPRLLANVPTKLLAKLPVRQPESFGGPARYLQPALDEASEFLKECSGGLFLIELGGSQTMMGISLPPHQLIEDDPDVKHLWEHIQSYDDHWNRSTSYTPRESKLKWYHYNEPPIINEECA